MSAPYEEQQLPTNTPGYPEQPGYDDGKNYLAPPPEYSAMPLPGVTQQGVDLPVIPGQMYPPPPAPALPQGQPQITTIFVNAPTLPEDCEFPKEPVFIICPSCHQAIVTVTTHECGLSTALTYTALIILGCLCGFIFIPFCVNGNRDVRHTCPSCNATVGVSKRFC